MFSANHHYIFIILLPFWRGGGCPVMSLMSLEVDAVSPSIFIFRKVNEALPPRGSVEEWALESTRRHRSRA